MLIALALIVAPTSQGAAERLTQVLRYLPSEGEFAGSACHGLVLQDENGIPMEVVNLGSIEPALCQAITRIDVDPEITRLALATGTRLLEGEPSMPSSELLDVSEMSEVVLPPIGFSQASIDQGHRVIVGTGLNYREHNVEVGKQGSGDPSHLLLFPKVTPPTSAYAPISTGTAVGSRPPRPVRLMDYEAELGLVLLQDIDLRNPPDHQTLRQQSALVAVNDVSDRGPIVIDDTYGYTRGKSHRGYLPLGPWMIPSAQIDLATGHVGQTSLEIALDVITAGQNPKGARRQRSRSTQMIHGPTAILEELSRRYLTGDPLCMPDTNGQPRYLHDGAGRIPAGSILLTGTPSGTAIRTPYFIDKIRLFLEGGFSIDGAREEWIEENEDAANRIGFLAPGDIVETWIEQLGRQRWTVAESDLGSDNGVPGSGSCDDFERH
ncbi:MAG: fumarylacetoacetate hydrolase family protein [Geminicoccaceae bacterium]